MKAWRNTLLRFGLVSIPVSLTPAKSKSGVSAHHYDGATGQRASQAFTVDGATVLPQTTLAYPDAAGNIGVPAEEVRVPDFAKEIRLQAFVSEGTVDPLFYEDAYCLFPGKGGGDGLGLVADILREDVFMMFAGEAVFTDRPRSVVIRWSEAAGCLILHTLTFVSRVRFADMQSAAEGLAEPSAELRQQAVLLTQSLPDTFLPLDRDAREDAILSALDKSPAVKGATPAPDTTPADILSALRADMQSRAKGTKGTKDGKSNSKTKGRTAATKA